MARLTQLTIINNFIDLKQVTTNLKEKSIRFEVEKKSVNYASEVVNPDTYFFIVKVAESDLESAMTAIQVSELVEASDSDIPHEAEPEETSTLELKSYSMVPYYFLMVFGNYFSLQMSLAVGAIHSGVGLLGWLILAIVSDIYIVRVLLRQAPAIFVNETFIRLSDKKGVREIPLATIATFEVESATDTPMKLLRFIFVPGLGCEPVVLGFFKLKFYTLTLMDKNNAAIATIPLSYGHWRKLSRFLEA